MILAGLNFDHYRYKSRRFKEKSQYSMENQKKLNCYIKLKATSVHEGFELRKAVENCNSNPHKNRKLKF